MRRRDAYKGKLIKKTQGVASVPMDCCSVPGVLLCLAVFLAAKGLAESQLSKCVTIVTKLESLVEISMNFYLIPSFPGSCICISQNMFEKGSIKEFVTNNGMSWSRCINISGIAKQFRDLHECFHFPKHFPKKKSSV